ncbi:MAG: hypothetical protein SFU86_00770 [Pirellulaceae bacterium]|nr:hypothetical protein [Pirellulaceae bacterium]
MASAPTSNSPEQNSTLRGVLSLVIFIHFFCVLVVLSSTFRRSELQARLVTLFGPYTTGLDFDPGYHTPYHYTLGRVGDNDAVIDIDLYANGEEPVANQPLIKSIHLPDGGSSFLGDRRRYFELAKRLALYADPEDGNDAMSSELARALGHRLMRENDARRAVVRCTRRLSQPLNMDLMFPNFPKNDPTAPAYDSVVYEADVWLDEDNAVQAQKRSSAAEVAPRRTAPSRGSSGPGATDPAPSAPATAKNPADSTSSTK